MLNQINKLDCETKKKVRLLQEKYDIDSIVTYITHLNAAAIRASFEEIAANGASSSGYMGVALEYNAFLLITQKSMLGFLSYEKAKVVDLLEADKILLTEICWRNGFPTILAALFEFLKNKPLIELGYVLECAHMLREITRFNYQRTSS